MNVVIIDDESSGRKAVRNCIIKYAPDLTILDEAEDVKTGIFSILTHQPDIVFLDIDMPDGTGFDLLEKLPKINFKVVFITAHEQYAIKAFKYSAIDYLLKPIDPDEFVFAISKLKTENKLDDIEQKVALLLQNKIKLEKIALPTSSGLKMIALAEIVRAESDNNYTVFFLMDKSKLMVSKTLKVYDNMLVSEGFYRTHKSHLVNIRHIKEYVNGEGGTVIMLDNSEIEVSRRKKEGLISALKF